MIAWLMLTVAFTEEPQKRLMVAAATLSGKPAASAAHRVAVPMDSPRRSARTGAGRSAASALSAAPRAGRTKIPTSLFSEVDRRPA